MKRRGAGGAAVLAFALALAGAVAVGPGARVAGAAPCVDSASHVGLVIDFDDHVSVECVDAGGATNGAQLLGSRARIGSSGLVCAIDGVPAAPDCGKVADGGHYAYWSYWHGSSGSWTYSNGGPATSRLKADVVEGWRWNPAGAGNPSDPAPRGSATATDVCVPAPPATDPAPPATSAPAASSAPSVSSSASATAPRATNADGVTAAEAPTTTVPLAAVTTTAGGGATGRAVPAAQPVAGVSRDRGPGGSVAGLVVGVGLLAAIGVAGAVIARRRASS